MLIGLNGHPESGKDTVYEFIKKRYPGTERLAFADPGKRIAAASLGISVEALEELKRKEDFYFSPAYQSVWVTGLGHDELIPRFSVRTFLRTLLNEAIKPEFGDEVWLNLVLPKSFVHSDRLVVITDVRFSFEIARIQFLGGVIIHINRAATDAKWKHDSHGSEQEYPDDLWDFIIDNNGTLTELESAVEVLMENLYLGAEGVKRIKLTDKQKHTTIPENERFH